METKNYSRKREATRKKIEDVFIEEYISKSVAEITVKDICNKAHINRSTFYTYYQDVFDIEDQLENRVIETFQENLLLQIAELINNPEMMLEAILRINQDEGYLPFVMVLKSNNNFASKISEKAIESLVDEEKLTKMEKERIKVMLMYHFAGVSAIISDMRNEYQGMNMHSSDRIDDLMRKNINILIPVIKKGLLPSIFETLGRSSL